MKIEIPLGAGEGGPRLRAAALRWAHTAIAIAAVVWLAYEARSAAGHFFADGAAATRHVADMLVFGGVGFALTVAIFWAIAWTELQRLFLPFHDEQRDLAAKWRRGEPLTDAEASFAMACAISSGARILGACIVIALTSTPL